MRRPHMAPMCPRELGDGAPPLPRNLEARDSRWRQRAITRGNLGPQRLACRLALRLGHGPYQRASRRWRCGRPGIQPRHNPGVPAPLCRPDAEGAVCHGPAPGWQAAGAQIAQDRSPRRLGLPLATFHREAPLLASRQHADEPPQGRLAVREPGLHIAPSRPAVDPLQVSQAAPLLPTAAAGRPRSPPAPAQAERAGGAPPPPHAPGVERRAAPDGPSAPTSGLTRMVGWWSAAPWPGYIGSVSRYGQFSPT
jgi:hypothetical protein